MSPTLKSIIKAALRDVNVLRAAFGMKPLRSIPKGFIGVGDSCPIANALGATSVGQNTFRKNVVDGVGNGSQAVFQMPRTIERFITAFDNQRYPRLIG
jgi:hypothetical protein